MGKKKYPTEQLQRAKHHVNMARDSAKAQRALNDMMVCEKPITSKNFCFSERSVFSNNWHDPKNYSFVFSPTMEATHSPQKQRQRSNGKVNLQWRSLLKFSWPDGFFILRIPLQRKLHLSSQDERHVGWIRSHLFTIRCHTTHSKFLFGNNLRQTKAQVLRVSATWTLSTSTFGNCPDFAETPVHASLAAASVWCPPTIRVSDLDDGKQQ